MVVYYNSVNRLLEIINKINITGSVEEQVNMSAYTTFKCGGPAEIFVETSDIEDVKQLKNASLEHGFPLFILGGGANILVSDRGIPGVTLSLNKLNNIEFEDDKVIVEAGVSVNTISESAEELSLSGLEFIYGMPGSIGGAVWMNARCYGDEISSHFLWADILTPEGEELRIYKDPMEWDYKISPFQKKGTIITRVCLQLKHGERELIKKEMIKNRKDRRDKGHFSYPCAGSVFKNNRDFGAPSGKIIEDAGLKGLRKGDAQISDFHANIIINLGNALSSDIDYLIKKTIQTVYKQRGFRLEPEVLKVGNWEE